MDERTRGRIGAITLVLAALAGLNGRGAAQENQPAAPLPDILPDDGEAEKALARIKLPDGFRAELFAAEPHCANLVALDVTPDGRCYLVETFRRDKQVLDMRDWPEWVEDDLACRTVADRVALIRKRAKDPALFRAASEKVRVVRDRDGDGRADWSRNFATGFDSEADGVAAGVLARGKDVYFADIPNLWKLTDEDGDGVAEQRALLATGFGVHFDFVGHDLHALRIGPDGRLWFSIGDRGLDVVTKEGRHLELPDCGAVLRCELDGSGLELVHVGLRNPQELAFNEVGDCFTCDNNSDGGDHARLVHIVAGADSGWRVGWQWANDSMPRSEWNREKMWQPRNPEQPAFLLPPVINLVGGPSGLTHEPGTCFPAKYRDHFFICDFEGEPNNTRVVAFSVAQEGAGYRLASEENFVSEGILATDCDFAADGCMYVSDWVHGWGQPRRGRVWRLFDPELRASGTTQRTHELLRAGFTQRDRSELMSLLADADQRVRLEAQLALAAQHDLDGLTTIARLSANPLARLHAVWGLGQIARAGDEVANARLVALLEENDDAEVRAQAAKVLGEAGARGGRCVAALIDRLADGSSRVRFFAALALVHAAPTAGSGSAVAPLVDLLRENDDADAELRHAGVMALATCADGDELGALLKDEARAVRLAALLALRRQGDARLVAALADADRSLVLEAARAIYDVPLASGMELLAKQLELPSCVEPPLALRAIAASFRLGGKADAERLAQFAAGRSEVDESLRLEAFRALEQFDAPPARDRLLGLWRPCAAPRAPTAVAALMKWLEPLLTHDTEPMREAAARFIGRNHVAGFGEWLVALVKDAARGEAVRVASLHALADLASAKLRGAIEAALASDLPKLRGAGRDALAKLDPAAALEILAAALKSGTIVERQDALATLGGMGDPKSAALLTDALDELLSDHFPPEATLDLLEAAGKRKGTAEIAARLVRYELGRKPDDPLAAWRECIAGGDADHGKKLFFERAELQCFKCHKVAGEGAGQAGPDLAGVATRHPAADLLDSIARPNAEIALGYRNTIFVLTTGQMVDGRVTAETATHFTVSTTDQGDVQVLKSAIKNSRDGQSAMPTDLITKMSKRDLRDLVAWLGTLK